MRSTVAALPTFDELRRYVHQTLCQHDHLDPAAAPMRQALIKRSGRPCGLLFQVQGPRALRTWAIWAADEHRILFYDSAGSRIAETRLCDSPDPLKLAA
ncbi:MAG: hypothetical protein NZ700_05745 [Gemmataceae bacterium]|nr:hypothetical protein [Gemmataceae bacterium]MDW8264757.1 hypothetical protein [Gemmataceae bacterium]